MNSLIRTPISKPQIPMKKTVIMMTTAHDGTPTADHKNCQFRP
jgi:hypothetical protein